MPGGRPGRRGPVERPPGRWAQRAAEAPAKGDERTRASRARRPRPFTNRSEISPTARSGVGGHEGLPGMPSGRSWPARAEKISKSALTGALWRAGTVVRPLPRPPLWASHEVPFCSSLFLISYYFGPLRPLLWEALPAPAKLPVWTGVQKGDFCGLGALPFLTPVCGGIPFSSCPARGGIPPLPSLGRSPPSLAPARGDIPLSLPARGGIPP